MATPPTFVLIPGHWHTPTHLKPLQDALTARSLPSKAVQLHTVGRKPGYSPRPTFSDDVSVIYSAVAKEILAGRDVCLVLHGYAGTPGAEAVNCLIKDGVVAMAEGEERERRPDSAIAGIEAKTRGGVVKVVFIAALVFPAKRVIDPKSFVGKDNPGFTIDDKNMVHMASPWHFFFNDLPLSGAKPFVDACSETYYVGQMQIMSDNWRKARICALLCSKDNANPRKRQEAAWNWLDTALEEEGVYEDGQWVEDDEEDNKVKAAEREKRRRIEWVEACHSPWVSRASEVADYLARMVGWEDGGG